MLKDESSPPLSTPSSKANNDLSSEPPAKRQQVIKTKDECENLLRKFASLLRAQSSQAKPPMDDVKVNAGNMLCGTQPNGNKAPVVRPKNETTVAPDPNVAAELKKYLVNDLSSPTGGAICAFPSLDLYSGEIADLPLPNVGASAKKTATEDETQEQIDAANRDAAAMPAPPFKIPAMVASLYHPPKDKLETKNGHSDSSISPDAASANANAVVLEQAAARNLSSVTTWTRSTLHHAPSAMLKALSQSFSSLVDARVRAWILLLLRHSLSRGDEQSRSYLMKLLATSHSIDLNSVSTSFQALSLPDGIRDQSDSSDSVDSKNQLFLPLIFEVMANIALQEEKVAIKLRAPGTIEGKFDPETLLFNYIKINLDTNALVASMVEQARLVVFKAVVRATSNRLGIGSKVPAGLGAPSVASLSQFNSALNLSQSGQSEKSIPKPIKSSPSSVIFQKSIQSSTTPGLSLTKNRKARSVTWNHPVEHASASNRRDAKRRKLSAPVTFDALKSSKSFGKPDASLFEAKRNATFAEFGRSPKTLLSRDRLKGNPTTCVDLSSASSSLGAGNASRQNAVFSAASLSITHRLATLTSQSSASFGSARAAALKAKASRSSNKNALNSGSSQPNKRPKLVENSAKLPASSDTDSVNSLSSAGNLPQPAMPRTLTNLENLLLAKTRQVDK